MAEGEEATAAACFGQHMRMMRIGMQPMCALGRVDAPVNG